MSGALAGKLASWLEEGKSYLGEICIRQTGSAFVLRHYLDAGAAELASYHLPEDAIELGKYDAAGNYRPLRSAPTLQRGWQLSVQTLEALVRALDFFYPAMLGTARAFAENQGHPIDLRDTLGRQTGMYRVAAKINPAQASALIGEVCHPSRCLKTITWQIDAASPVSSIRSLPLEKTRLADDLLPRPLEPHGFIPLPCEECCNILVAAARETVKKAASPTPASP